MKELYISVFTSIQQDLIKLIISTNLFSLSSHCYSFFPENNKIHGIKLIMTCAIKPGPNKDKSSDDSSNSRFHSAWNSLALLCGNFILPCW